jgi:hypothetical protein
MSSVPGSASIYTHGIFILGAGFSRAAGLPLGNELWKEVLRRALSMEGKGYAFAKFREDLDEYLEFKKRCDGQELSYASVDFEEFLGFLDIEHHLGLRGADTWSDDGNEGQVLIKALIGQILTENTPEGQNIPAVYLDFARKLKPLDRIITFNYDILLERALQAGGVAYRLYPERFLSVDPRSRGSIDVSHDEVVVLKVHGSVDWFDKRSFWMLKEQARADGFPAYSPYDPVFNSSKKLTVLPLAEGPRPTDDPLRDIHRLIEVESFYADPPWFETSPTLINPSTAKSVYSAKFRDFWRGLAYTGQASSRMTIIGYSLPRHDDYARQVVYRLVKNYQDVAVETLLPNVRPKSPLLIVDFLQGEAQRTDFSRRYSFVDWDRTVLCANGFDEDAVSRL